MSEYAHSFDAYCRAAEARVEHAGWVGYQAEWMPGGVMVTGAVPDGTYKRGPRKGQPRLSGPDVRHRLKVIVSVSEMDEAARRQEIDTGRCYNCKGSGQTIRSARLVDGLGGVVEREYRPCRRCDGTGWAPR